LVGSYYQDVDLSSKNLEQEEGRHPIDWPVFTTFKFKRLDKVIDFDWGEKAPGPGMTGVFWSAKWVGKIFVPKDDVYRFRFKELDDGGRLFLDGKKIIDVWRVQKSSPVSGQMSLKRGAHVIEIHYVQGPAVHASLSLMWSSSSFPEEVVGAYVDAK
jgi:hypothetical protein